jgi:tetratricopeptide (TPR) repeat protein
VAKHSKKTIALKFILTCLIALVLVPVLAQSEKEKLAEIQLARENQKQALILQQLDSAVELMNIGRYEAADVIFKNVLQNIKSVPSDLAYYFGENSYHLGLTRQSIDWLNKYIQLKGTSGKFYKEAVDYLKKAEYEMTTVKTGEVKTATEILSRNFDIDCGPTGKVVCPICNGSTVVVKKSYLGDSYKTCTYCNKLGYLTCADYNKLLRGELKPNGN